MVYNGLEEKLNVHTKDHDVPVSFSEVLFILAFTALLSGVVLQIPVVVKTGFISVHVALPLLWSAKGYLWPQGVVLERGWFSISMD